MKKAYVFPGQGSQFPGMAKDLYESNATAKEMLEKANEILKFRITDIMFEGTPEELKATNVTQPAVFLHSTVLAKCYDGFRPDMVAGHSLGEFSALETATEHAPFKAGEKRFRRVERRDAAFLQDRDATAQGLRFGEIVGRQNDRVTLLVKPADEGPEIFTKFHVDPGRRFVEDDHGRFVDERLRNEHAALHAARERPNVRLGLVDEPETLHDTLPHYGQGVPVKVVYYGDCHDKRNHPPSQSFKFHDAPLFLQEVLPVR